MNNEPLISVVILSHNKIDYTRTCIHSLLETDYRNWELIIIDNGSTDGTVDWLKSFKEEAESHHVDVHLIFNSGNIGCSTSRNQGIEKAKGEFITFCDNDIALRSKNWLRHMSQFLASDPAYGMVGPKIIYPFAPFNIQCAGVAVSPTGRVQFRGRGNSRTDENYNSATEVQALISACCMVKKSVLDQVGGFDEIFNPVEYEDIDLSYRIRANGYSVWYDGNVEMYHFENVTTEGTATLPNTYLIVKHGMIFKQRWQDMFNDENGPADEDCKWKTIPTKKLSEIGNLEII